MLTISLVLLILYAHWAPSSRLGALMRDVSEAACRRLSRVRPLTIFLVVVFVAALGAFAYAEADGFMLAIPAGAEGLTFFAAMDVGTYVEVIAVAWLLGAGGVLRRTIHSLRAKIWPIAAWRRSRLRSGRAPRTSAARRAARARQSDEDEPAQWSFPAALAA